MATTPFRVSDPADASRLVSAAPAEPLTGQGILPQIGLVRLPSQG
jgi:hypothetical protein